MSERKYIYRGFSLIAFVLFFATECINVQTPSGQDIINLVGSCLGFAGMLLAFLWLYNWGLIIALTFYFISFNLDLYLNPLTHWTTSPQLLYDFRYYNIIVLAIAFVLLLLGLWSKNPVAFFTREVELKEYIPIVSVVIAILVLQLTPRFIS